MNWLTEDLSSNRKVKIISPITHPIYFEREGKQKLLKIWHEKKLVKMRNFIQENKDNKIKIEDGYNTYKYEIDDYKKILQEEGLYP